MIYYIRKMRGTIRKWRFDKIIVIDRDMEALGELCSYIEKSTEVSEVLFFRLNDLNLVLEDLEKLSQAFQVPELIVINVTLPTADILRFVKNFDYLPEFINDNCKIVLVSDYYSNFNGDPNVLEALEYPFIISFLESSRNDLKFSEILRKYHYTKPIM